MTLIEDNADKGVQEFSVVDKVVEPRVFDYTLGAEYNDTIL